MVRQDIVGGMWIDAKAIRYPASCQRALKTSHFGALENRPL
jgi:hypothetical protein